MFRKLVSLYLQTIKVTYWSEKPAVYQEESVNELEMNRSAEKQIHDQPVKSQEDGHMSPHPLVFGPLIAGPTIKSFSNL